MLEWAAAGVIRVANVMHRTGRRIKTALEFYSQHPNLQRGVYEEIVSLMPEEWHHTLRTGGVRTTGWWAQGNEFLHVTEHETRTYEKQGTRETLQNAKRPAQLDLRVATRCVVKCAPPEKQHTKGTPNAHPRQPRRKTKGEDLYLKLPINHLSRFTK